MRETDDGKIVSKLPGFNRICWFYEDSAIDVNDVKPLKNVVSGRYRMDGGATSKKTITISQYHGKTLLGIYKLEGSQLSIAYRVGGPRPERFESVSGSGVALLTLERSKPRVATAVTHSRQPGECPLTTSSSTTSPTVADGKQPPFEVRLPSGVTVELYGVSEYPSKHKSWWRPDGSPLVGRPYDWLGASVADQKGKIGREIAVRLHDLPSEIVGTSWQFDPPCDFATGNPSRLGSGLKDLRAVAMRAPAASRTVTVRFGAAGGPWKTVAESQGRGGDVLGGDAVFSPAVEKNGDVILSVAHRFAGQDARVVAGGRDGQERLGTPGQHGGGGNVYQMTITFSKLSLKDVKVFRLQTRPYEWAEFRHVSLRSGQKTYVDVVVSSTSPPAGNHPAADKPRRRGTPVPDAVP